MMRSGDGCAGVGDQLAEARYSTAAGHTAQLGVSSGLQRQMQMGAETPRPALPEVEEAFGQLPGFQTAEAQAGDVGVGEDGRGQLLEIGALAPGEIPAESTEVDTGEHGFAVAVADQCLDFLHYIGSGAAAAVAAQGGNDAERAAVLATVLDFDEGACASAVLVRGSGGKGGYRTVECGRDLRDRRTLRSRAQGASAASPWTGCLRPARRREERRSPGERGWRNSR